MPEGDNVFRQAKQLNTALSGRMLTGCDLRVPRFATTDLSGLRVHEAVSHGKHLLIRVGDYSSHSHLKMDGLWHVYPLGARWRKPAFKARAVLTVEGDELPAWQAVGFDLGVLEVVPTAAEGDIIGHLGPDLLGEDWDEAEALRRLGTHPSVPIGAALLDQRNLAGLGNIYSNELCFMQHVHPSTPAGKVDLEAMVRLAHRLLLANRDPSPRSMTGLPARGGDGLWVYSRSGNPCRRCGTPIAHGLLDADVLPQRDIWFCPTCQAKPGLEPADRDWNRGRKQC